MAGALRAASCDRGSRRSSGDPLVRARRTAARAGRGGRTGAGRNGRGFAWRLRSAPRRRRRARRARRVRRKRRVGRKRGKRGERRIRRIRRRARAMTACASTRVAGRAVFATIVPVAPQAFDLEPQPLYFKPKDVFVPRRDAGPGRGIRRGLVSAPRIRREALSGLP